MIERNFRNAIIWKEPGRELLDLQLLETEVDTDEFREIFDKSVTSELVRDDESLEKNLP